MLKKLLLADDSLTIQKVVGIVFANLDYQLLIVDNGNAALAMARKEFPDLIIADIGMPGMDGLELCSEIKNDVALSQIPVLLLPGAFENFDEKKAVAAGADGWLTKPFESQSLINKVEELLGAASKLPAAVDASPESIADTSAFEPEFTETVAAESSDIFATLDSPAVEEPVDVEIPESASEEPISFETPETLATEDIADFETPEDIVDFALPVADEEIVRFETPAIDEPAVAEDDIWDAVTFEEEDLQTESNAADVATEAVEKLMTFEEAAPILEEAAPILEEAAPIFEEAAPIFEEAAPIFEEAAPILEEAAPILEEAAPILEATGFQDDLEDEVIDLGEDDILELDDDAIIDEETEDPLEPLIDEPETVEIPAFGVVDFSAPVPPTEEEQVVGSGFEPEEFVSEPEPEAAIDEEDVFVSSAAEGLAENQAALESVSTVDVAAVEAQLSQLDESTLEELVKKVAGPIVEKLAGQLLEQVIWEVVPDLAESMIKEEIRKIKDGAD